MNAKNEGAFDGSNPVQGAMIPGIAREPKETFDRCADANSD